MLRIFHTHPARTSLLQDFAFYEVRERKVVFAFDLVFSLRVASSDAEDAAAATTATRNHTRQYDPAISFPSPAAAGYVLDDEHGEHGKHSCYVWSNVAGHGWRSIAAYALHADGHGHDEPAVRYAADPGHAPECPAPP